MARKVVGQITREKNRGVSRESINYRGPKMSSGAYYRPGAKIEAPPSDGIGPYYRDE